MIDEKQIERYVLIHSRHSLSRNTSLPSAYFDRYLNSLQSVRELNTVEENFKRLNVSENTTKEVGIQIRIPIVIIEM